MLLPIDLWSYCFALLNCNFTDCHSRQLVFVVAFTVFLANCVDYDILFANKFVNHTDSLKVTLPDAFLPVDVCSARYISSIKCHIRCAYSFILTVQSIINPIFLLMYISGSVTVFPSSSSSSYQESFGSIVLSSLSTTSVATGRSDPFTSMRWKYPWWAFLLNHCYAFA